MTDTSITYENKLKVYSTELIDVKTRKILQSYPLTRKIYDDYLDIELRCGTKTPLQYKDSIKFGQLVDNFWVDIVEQVIPSTAMWDSTYVYRNSMFDASKTQYKKYTLFNGDDLGSLPFDTIAVSENVELLTYDITNLEETPECVQVVIGTGDTRNVAIAQMDCGSEFYGSITIIGGEGQEVNTCDISIDVINIATGPQDAFIRYEPIISNNTGTITYSWVINSSTVPVTFTDTGTSTSTLEMPIIDVVGVSTVVNVTLTVIDSEGCEISSSITINTA